MLWPPHPLIPPKKVWARGGGQRGVVVGGGAPEPIVKSATPDGFPNVLPRDPCRACRRSLVPHAVSFFGGFRTTAPLLVASSLVASSEVGRHPKPFTIAEVDLIDQDMSS